MKTFLCRVAACLMLLAALPASAQIQNNPSVVLLTAATTNGAGAAVVWRGGPGELVCSGVWASASVVVNILGPDNATYVSTGATMSANGVATFNMPSGTIEAVVSGATGTTSVSCSVSAVPTFVD
jgi:hypothetical protein